LDDGNRLDDNEIEIIKLIQQHIPVIVIVTQSIASERTKKFMDDIRERTGILEDVMPIMAVEKIEKTEFGCVAIKEHGLDVVLKRSKKMVLESITKTLQHNISYCRKILNL